MYANSLYGQALFGADSSDLDLDGAYVDLMTFLPDYYQGNNEMNKLQTILCSAVGEITNNTLDTLDQCFVSSATWGLTRWEKIFGLLTDMSMPYERRREILKAKIRGAGRATKEKIKIVAIAFSNGEVSIREYPEEYRFVIRFIGIKGIPQNMIGLIAAIDEIKPAHIGYTFEYVYNTWNAVSSMTWLEASTYTWEGLRVK